MPEAPKLTLKYKVQIIHNDKVLAEEVTEASEEILGLGRERHFSMTHAIQSLADKCVTKAIKTYDESQ